MKSKKPSKQRLIRKKAPMHARHKMMSCHLSPELKKKYKKRSVPVRKGDEVMIMRGSHKGQKGKVKQVKRKNFEVFIEDIVYEKKDGTKELISFDTSNLMITSLDLSDAKRLRGVKQ